jgi:hypothetical protein
LFYSFLKDEKAIAEAVAQVEREIEEEEFRENPSVWDIVGKPQAANTPVDYSDDKNMTVGIFCKENLVLYSDFVVPR